MNAIPIRTFLPAILPLKTFTKGQLIERIGELEDAIAHLNKAQEALGDALARMNALSNDLSNTLVALVDAFDADDQNAIAMRLRAMSDFRKEQRKGVH